MSAAQAELSQEDIEVCRSMQQEEWEVLQSIYPECSSDDISRGGIKLEIPVELGDSRDAEIVDDGSLAVPGELPEDAPSRPNVHEQHLGPMFISLSTLPPLLLDIVVPPSYPLQSPPLLLNIHATHSWLSRPVASLLRQQLIDMWAQGDGVLYAWVEWIRSGDFLESVGLNDNGVIRLPHPSPARLSSLLTSHETLSAQAQFSYTSHPCAICMTSLKGYKCIRLICSHVFCRPCLHEYWGMAIREGSISSVRCPDPECVKEGVEATEEEVRRVVSEEDVRRWKRLREKRDIDRDPTIIHCPLDFCQTPVPKPRNVTDDESSGWDRLRTCHECGYSFCAYCRRTWHGPHTSCPIPFTASFILTYLAHGPGSPERLAIESRYGRANVTRLVAQYEEDKANREWLEKETTTCPNCEIKVQKSMGCNHMTCARCKTHFCYRCGTKLNASHPYAHFSTPGLLCYSKLFDHESIADQDEWQPIEGFEDL
ncbi:hypothetical protein GLOTRDRAFT_53527 [Gloeophyllum trabeum ATCC 11539]|uniref:RBR-type E3 ubiquitin transferase n=1 Tax=Gloeophyllum trabeum (strain ATCC 11539 / FP-39264 / Madison 617) TaxID=670483 RepID=S7S0P0_GLOTA|nr:uncharacterized protein GLOTRDRAFT_53527 [Gloeophyllum trabeum ATCC 11539]EPQ60930.1 hypothetical protein GLOTRDRAFT_53527 [Gloeophyllum trabeum ATCC 11539]